MSYNLWLNKTTFFLEWELYCSRDLIAKGKFSFITIINFVLAISAIILDMLEGNIWQYLLLKAVVIKCY